MGRNDADFGTSGPTAEMIDDFKNITKDTPDVADGVIVRDAEGKLKLRVHGGYQVFVDKSPVADVEHAAKLKEKFKVNRFALDDIKILFDGELVGKEADMLVLDSDITVCAPEHIVDAKENSTTDFVVYEKIFDGNGIRRS